MVQAINQAIAQEMERDKSVIVLGEDVAVDGGVFRVTDGLVTKFGKERVIDTPLAEAGIVGTAVGLAINGTGLAPVLCVRKQGLLVALRSGSIGIAATLADVIALSLLVEVAGFEPRVANVPALLVGVLIQFLGNKLFAFADRSNAWARQGVMFALVECGALALNTIFFDIVVASGVVPYLVARFLVQGIVYFGFSMPLWSRIFSRRTA